MTNDERYPKLFILSLSKESDYSVETKAVTLKDLESYSNDKWAHVASFLKLGEAIVVESNNEDIGVSYYIITRVL